MKKTTTVAAPKPPKTELEKFNDFQSGIEGTLAYLHRKLDTFTQKLAEDPSHAFEWGDQAAESAAKLRPYLAAQEFIKIAIERAPEKNLTEELAGETMVKIYDYFLNETLVKAKYSSQSCSTLSNNAKRCELAGYAEVADVLRNLKMYGFAF